MQYVCDAGSSTWFRIETHGEAALESAAMNHSVEKYFLEAREAAQRSHVPPKGVRYVEVGFGGGHTDKPTYEQVSTRTTGHAETIMVVYDPKVVTYSEILEVFWTIHDPTVLNREGNDAGDDYRSAVFYTSDSQKKTAEEAMAAFLKKGTWSKIITSIEPFKNYYRAEDYHQNYYNMHKSEGYCAGVVAHKVDIFETAFKDKLKK